jgi:hypothetical protein
MNEWLKWRFRLFGLVPLDFVHFASAQAVNATNIPIVFVVEVLPHGLVCIEAFMVFPQVRT